MQLHKTDKARTELQSGTRTLGQRERTMLILADGKNTIQSIDHLFKGEGQQLAKHLAESGYLVLAPVISAAEPKKSTRMPSDASQQAAVSADSFGGKRSLATTRMFLFDICERMFVRRDPALAEHFRESLRNARDRDSMLEVARAMVLVVEDVAGRERADSISARIAMLLPQD